MSVKQNIDNLQRDLKVIIGLLETAKSSINSESALRSADGLLISTYSNMNEAREKLEKRKIKKFYCV